MMVYCKIPANTGGLNEIVIVWTIEVINGDDGGGCVIEESIKAVSPILKFESLLDKCPTMYEDLTSSVLDLVVGPLSGINAFSSGVVVEAVSLFMMFLSTLYVFT